MNWGRTRLSDNYSASGKIKRKFNVVVLDRCFALSLSCRSNNYPGESTLRYHRAKQGSSGGGSERGCIPARKLDEAEFAGVEAGYHTLQAIRLGLKKKLADESIYKMPTLAI